MLILVTARMRIDTHADLVLPERQADVARLVGGWWPSWSRELLGDWLSDPVTLLLVGAVFGLLLLYVALDALGERLGEATLYRCKLALVYAIVLAGVFGKTALLIGLRHVSGPASYTHDGGVIQTEATIEYLLEGKNPYVEDYTDTPMAGWGLSYRSALYHYPYLPWTFLFSAPFYLLSRALWGWYDQRFVYLLLFALTLLLAPALARGARARLCLTMVLGLNPLLALDVVFGQNDSFVLFWLALAIWLLASEEPRRLWLASASYGLACASKPTAWFLAPFLALYLLRDRPLTPKAIPDLLRRSWPGLATFALAVGPWLVWNPEAMYDDVWCWSAGTAQVPYQIGGWGLANFVLAFGLVPDRLAYFPFWLPELLVGLPLLLALLWRQRRENGLAAMLYGYALLLFAFLYVSRFLNENYLGYLLGVFALAWFVEEKGKGPG